MVKTTQPGEKHFTASVLIVSKELPRKIVLVHHKKTGMWMQPGGHIEPFENPVEAAIREVQEETRLDISFLRKKIKIVDQFASFLPTPDFFLEEIIPAHKNEPKHYHLDLFYRVELPLQDTIMQEAEAHAIGWFSLEEALQLPMYENTKILVKRVLENS